MTCFGMLDESATVIDGELRCPHGQTHQHEEED